MNHMNCTEKVIERVIADPLSKYCENNFKFHRSQIEAGKNKSAIDKVAFMIDKIEKIWNQEKLKGAFFLQVKGAFDYVCRVKLVHRMVKLEIDRDFIC